MGILISHQSPLAIYFRLLTRFINALFESGNRNQWTRKGQRDLPTLDIFKSLESWCTALKIDSNAIRLLIQAFNLIEIFNRKN